MGLRATFFLMSGLLLPALAWAHGDHSHPPKVLTPTEAAPESPRSKAIQRIALAYDAELKQIFQQKCYDCHSQNPRYPWYYHYPFVKQYIDHDLSEARRHLDLTKGYPFVSHATMLEDIKALREVAQEMDMPPLVYRWAHEGSALTEDDKARIFRWTAEADNLLRSIGEQ